MKRLILTVSLLLSLTALAAQNYIVVDSEKVFKSIDAYNKALTELDELARQYQAQVDGKYAVIEQLYETTWPRKRRFQHKPANHVKMLSWSRKKRRNSIKKAYSGTTVR